MHHDQRSRALQHHLPSEHGTDQAPQGNTRLVQLRARRLQRATLLTVLVGVLSLLFAIAGWWWLWRQTWPVPGHPLREGPGRKHDDGKLTCSDLFSHPPPSDTCTSNRSLSSSGGDANHQLLQQEEGCASAGKRVVHATLYNGEADLLWMKLYELFDVVDVFIVVESLYTFRGAAKPARRSGGGGFFRIDDARWAPFRSKLRPLMVDFDPKEARYHPWLGERTVRSALYRHLIHTVLHPGDVVFTADVDEIVSRSVVTLLRTCRVPWDACGGSVRLHLTMHYYEFGLIPRGGERWWPIAVHQVSHASLRRARLSTPLLERDDDAAAAAGDVVAMRRMPVDPHQHGWTDPFLRPHDKIGRQHHVAKATDDASQRRSAMCDLGRDGAAVGRVGWHISWGFQHVAAFLEKLSSFSHAEFDGVDGIRSPLWIHEAVCSGRDVLRRRPTDAFWGLERIPGEYDGVQKQGGHAALPQLMVDEPSSLLYLRPWRCRQRGGAPS